MPIEIERKFLVKLENWNTNIEGIPYRQGYLSINDKNVVRVRVKGTVATITIKSHEIGISRSEHEYEIPIEDADYLMNNLCVNEIIEKTRYKVPYKGKVWDVDEFHGNNNGLWLAEIELDHEEEDVNIPSWAGKEVTGDVKYYNAYLSNNPFHK